MELKWTEPMTIGVPLLTRMVGSGVGGAISTRGIRKSDASVLRPVKQRFFKIFLYLYSIQISILKILLFLPLFNSVAKNKTVLR
jgi:hypothetical protein